jgi:hypothetical protein
VEQRGVHGVSFVRPLKTIRLTNFAVSFIAPSEIHSGYCDIGDLCHVGQFNYIIKGALMHVSAFVANSGKERIGVVH